MGKEDLAVTYEFEKMQIKTSADYIFQLVKDRRLTDIYHSHDFYELIFFVLGSGIQQINGRERVCEKNTVVLLRPGDEHCFTAQSEDITVLSLSVKKEEFELFSSVYDPFLLSDIQKKEDAPSFISSCSFMSDALGSDSGQVATEYDCKFLLSGFLKSYIDCESTQRWIPAFPLCLAVRSLK